MVDGAFLWARSDSAEPVGESAAPATRGTAARAYVPIQRPPNDAVLLL
jgi:hypothetical protein